MITSREKQILDILREQQPANIQLLLENLEEKDNAVSKATLNRDLDNLEKKGFILKFGQGKATKYEIKMGSTFQIPIDLDQYFTKSNRTKIFQFNTKIFSILDETPIFSDEEQTKLYELNNKYKRQIKSMQQGLLQKEFERLTIDLSWKSSQIEGNTYDLLETATLILDGIKAKDKPDNDAQMILNHKKVIDFILKNKNGFKIITVDKISELHSILIDKLPVAKGIRKSAVGISGTNYEPLSDEPSIKRALSQLCELINSKSSLYEKAFLALIMISYIQAFIDGNKRTARMVCNAILVANNSYPISFRNTDINYYRKSIILFYELNNFYELKKLFIDQYEFAGREYFHIE
jgi:Fic family protein